MSRRVKDDEHLPALAKDEFASMAFHAAENSVVDGLAKLRAALHSMNIEEAARARDAAAASAVVARYRGMARAARAAVHTRLMAEAELGERLPDPEEAVRWGADGEPSPAAAASSHDGSSQPEAAGFTKDVRRHFRRVKEVKGLIDQYAGWAEEQDKELTREGLYRYARELAESMAAAERAERPPPPPIDPDEEGLLDDVDPWRDEPELNTGGLARMARDVAGLQGKADPEDDRSTPTVDPSPVDVKEERERSAALLEAVEECLEACDRVHETVKKVTALVDREGRRENARVGEGKTSFWLNGLSRIWEGLTKVGEELTPVLKLAEDLRQAAKDARASGKRRR